MTKAPNKYERAYLANHLYNRFLIRWPETKRDWHAAIETTHPLYLASLAESHNAGMHPDSSTIKLWNVLKELHGV